MNLPLKPYLVRCRLAADAARARGLEPETRAFQAYMCRYLRLTGGRTELRRIELQGGGWREVEVWCGTSTPVPDWYNDAIEAR